MIRVGLVGCGRIARVGHAPAYRALESLVHVVALADPIAASRDRVGELLDVPVARRHASIESLLDEGGVDVVDVATPNVAHLIVVRAALRAGVPVLVEKPLGRTLSDAIELVRLAEETGVGLAVCHNRVFDPAFALAADITRSGAIGHVHTVRLESLAPRHWPGTEDYDPDWRTRAAVAGGGALLDNGYHLVYLAELLTASPITSVFARIDRRTGIEVDDVALLSCLHADGSVSSLQLGWSAPGGGQAVHEAYGTAGSVAVHRGGHTVSMHRTAIGHWEHRDVLPDDDWGYQGLFRATLPALVEQVRPPVTAEDARHVQQVIAAAYRSGRSRREEAVDDRDARRPHETTFSNWDVRHLLLSIDDKPRPRRDREDLDAVVRRVAVELEQIERADVTVSREWLRDGALLEGIPLWLFETNAWVLAPHGDDGDCVVVDVPPNPVRLLERLEEHRLRVAAVFLTHGHLDHAGGVAALLAARPEAFPVFVHPADRLSVLRPGDSDGLLGRVLGRSPLAGERLVDVHDEARLDIAGTTFVTLHTPGHTPGSISVLAHGAGRDLLFTGDHLFADGAGRTDLPGGSERELCTTLVSVTAPLDDAVVVLPGHGRAAELGSIRRRNPLLARLLPRPLEEAT